MAPCWPAVSWKWVRGVGGLLEAVGKTMGNPPVITIFGGWVWVVFQPFTVCLFVCSFVGSFVRLFVCLFVRLFVCLSARAHTTAKKCFKTDKIN